MRLMVLTETYPPEVNGVAMTLSRLATGLVARGHQVHIVRPQQNKADKAPPEGSNPSHTLVWGLPFPWYKGLSFGMPYWGQLRKLIKIHKPDFIHIATEGWLGLAGLMAAKAYGVPIVSSYHTSFFTYARFYGPSALALRRIGFEYFRVIHNATLKTFVPSSTELNKLAAYKFKNLAIMARGVDTVLYDPAKRDESLRTKWGVGPNDIVMLYVGRIAPEKNLTVMFKAFERLKKDHPTARLVLVGDGPDRAHYEKKHPDYIFEGTRYKEPLARYYASADLFVFASVTETFGNVVTEAMASGLVVLAYDYAAPREHILPGVNGYLAPYKNEKAFLERFEEMLTQRDLWPQIRQEARATACALSWEKVVAMYEEDLLKLKAHARPQHSTPRDPIGV